jgi:hypothetical protein
LLAAFLLIQPALAQDSDTNQLISFLQGKTTRLLEFSPTIEIPFAYAGRPTIEMRVGQQTFQMLLDSGTRLSILNLLAGDQTDISTTSMSHTAELADLDGRPQIDFEDHTLSYASVAYASAGDLRLRNLPFRIYTYNDKLPGADFQGSLALQSLRNATIEFDNSREQLRLYFDNSFKPDTQSLAVPILQLQGLWLVKARAGEEELLLLVDTGFSGELLLGPRAITSLGNQLTGTGETSSSYAGFHNVTSGELAILDSLSLQAQPWPGLAEGTMQLLHVNTVLMPNFIEETALGQLDGIIGSGLLSRYNYAVDQNRSVMFIQDR